MTHLIAAEQLAVSSVKPTSIRHTNAWATPTSSSNPTRSLAKSSIRKRTNIQRVVLYARGLMGVE